MKKTFIGAVLIILVAVIAIFIYYFHSEKVAISGIKTFEECVANGFLIAESMPRTCRTPDGKIFTEGLVQGNPPEDVSSLIKVNNPKSGQVVTNPILIEGEARGNWYFEASFPIQLLDAEGNLITSTYATAQGDWMTTDFVPFKSLVSYPATTTGSGILLIMNDNPSGLPENSKELRIPVIFGKNIASTTASTTTACKVTGCSSQICSDTDVVTTCEYTEKYACYKKAKCERQKDGKCGWTMTPELKSCLKN